MGTLDISVIVPCRGHARELEAMLASLAEQTLERERFEVLVVDDGGDPPLELTSSDAARAMDLRVIRQHAAGPAAARNKAIASARGRLLVLLNADAILAPDGLALHLAAHQGGATRAVMGRFDFLPEHETPFVTLANALGTLFPYHLLEPGQPLPFEFFWTGNLSVPAEIVRAVGGFDERFRRPLFEDVELGYRLNQIGVPLFFDRAIRCGHDHPITFDSWLARAERIGYEWVVFARRHGGRPFRILDGEDEPDDRLLQTVVAGLLHEHDAHRFRVHELREMLADADRRLAQGEERVHVDARLLVEAQAHMIGINTIQRMRGILAHLVGYTPEELARHRAELRPFAIVHPIAETADLEDTRRILELAPADSPIIVPHRHWVPPQAVPKDPRVTLVRLAPDAPFDDWRPLLDATPCNTFIIIDHQPLPTTSELQALVRFLEVSPRIGALGLAPREGRTHTAAAVTPRIPTRVLAMHRKILLTDRPSATDDGPRFLDRLLARGLVLAAVIPAGNPTR
ncbi:MAG: glycosyltransferase [Deltaproteobacteria bacterium]|nr:glycosyltransferase [Deltaproteobacteria bacterium]